MSFYQPGSPAATGPADALRAEATLPDEVRRVIVLLLRGVLYVDRDEHDWQRLLTHRAPVRDYLAVLGVQLVLDEGEGYAYLKQSAPPEADSESGAVEIPSLIPRRSLSYSQSLLCVLLRRRLLESDTRGGVEQTVVTRDEMVDMVHVLLPESASEARRVDRIDTSIRKLANYGFLRKLKGQKDAYEVRRIVKAIVDAE
ncbi:MAG: DUF4194 domain-containing protein, partial [Myxococcota bacterium]